MTIIIAVIIISNNEHNTDHNNSNDNNTCIYNANDTTNDNSSVDLVLSVSASAPVRTPSLSFWGHRPVKISHIFCDLFSHLSYVLLICSVFNHLTTSAQTRASAHEHAGCPRAPSRPRVSAHG